MRQSLFALIAFLAFAPAAYGCSMLLPPIEDNPQKQEFLAGKKLYKKDVSSPDYYVFIGEVVGIVKATKAEAGEGRMDAEGVKIKVAENIYTPRAAAYFEVFPLAIHSDCSLQGVTGLERSFPLGSQVRVVAFDSTIYKKQPSPDSAIRLEASYYNRGSLVRNDLNEAFRSSAESVFDYAGLSMRNPVTDAERETYDSKIRFLDFELQKDLIRLATTKSRSERLSVLKRLVYYPFPHGFAFKSLAHTYLKPGKDLSALEKKWEEHIQELAKQTK